VRRAAPTRACTHADLCPQRSPDPPAHAPTSPQSWSSLSRTSPALPFPFSDRTIFAQHPAPTGMPAHDGRAAPPPSRAAVAPSPPCPQLLELSPAALAYLAHTFDVYDSSRCACGSRAGAVAPRATKPAPRCSRGHAGRATPPRRPAHARASLVLLSRGPSSHRTLDSSLSSCRPRCVAGDLPLLFIRGAQVKAQRSAPHPRPLTLALSGHPHHAPPPPPALPTTTYFYRRPDPNPALVAPLAARSGVLSASDIEHMFNRAPVPVYQVGRVRSPAGPSFFAGWGPGLT
jgi:hypothetical protein